MADNLPDLLSAFEVRAAELAKELKETRDKVAAARQKLEGTSSDRQEAADKLGKLRSQTHAFNDPSQRNAFLARQTAMENQVGLFDGQIGDQRRELNRLEAHEDNLVRQIESQKNLFVIHLHEVAGQIGDGAVRYLFVKRALAECPRLEIAPEKFSEPASQSAISSALGDLRDVQANSDQREGTLFETVEALSREVETASQASIAREAREQETNTTLTAKKEKLKTGIAELERPETPEEIQGRKVRWWIGLGAAAVFAIAIAVVWLLIEPLNWLVVAALGALALLSLGFSWWNSNFRRSQSLSSKKRALADTEQKITASKTEEAAADAAEAAQAGEFRRRIADTGGTVPAAGAGPVLTDLSAAAARRLADWIAAHPDYRYLVKA